MGCDGCTLRTHLRVHTHAHTTYVIYGGCTEQYGGLLSQSFQLKSLLTFDHCGSKLINVLLYPINAPHIDDTHYHVGCPKRVPFIGHDNVSNSPSTLLNTVYCLQSMPILQLVTIHGIGIHEYY